MDSTTSTNVAPSLLQGESLSRGTTPDREWFSRARFGLFLHWGPYAEWGRGEQVLYREHLDQREYENRACAWNPQHFDAEAWVAFAVSCGVRYVVLTTRHHDGYCLWDSSATNYTSSQQAPRRDFVGEFVEAARRVGLRIGLYYSLADWRLPAYWSGPEREPRAWETYRAYIHAQVRELCGEYGKIDLLWFDGCWPYTAEQWGGKEIVSLARGLQPHILINNRLGLDVHEQKHANANESRTLGDFGTPEHCIVADPDRPWEACRTTTWRLWGYTKGERWISASSTLDYLCQTAQQGGNLLLNVGPTGEGLIPAEAVCRYQAIGGWLKVHREAIDASEHTPQGLTESVSYGYQTVQGDSLFLIMRFWSGESELRLPDIVGPIASVELMSNAQPLAYTLTGTTLVIHGLPQTPPCELFPAIRIRFTSTPQTTEWGRSLRLWSGEPHRRAEWARARGESVNVTP